MGLDPATIGRYVVLGTLGQGAMGTVYLGEDPMLKRGVALKVVHRGKVQDRETALRRFRREAEISARLNHPNVITVFDVGEEEGVGPFLAMEFIEGETLDSHIQAGPLEPRHAVEILVQAGAALGAAHALGIVHRDVKPANLMVAKDGRVKLMDFGIAKGEEQSSTTAALLCTPGYAAPELLDGAEATAATDRWAFAVTAFECLQGRPPFDGDSLSVVLYNVAHGEPVFGEGLEPGLAEVFRRALAKAPAARFPDLPAFLAALVQALPLEDSHRRRFLETLGQGRPAPAEPLGPARERPDPRRVRRLVRLTVGVAAAGLLFLGWWEGLLLPRRLHIESDPSGAQVIVDGRLRSRTPDHDLRLPMRSADLLIEKEGYYPFPHALAPTDRKLRVKLSPLYLTLTFDSRPSGAAVYVNGRPAGTTPLKNYRVRNDLRGGSLLVSREGFQSYGATLDVDHLPPALIILEPKHGKD